MSNTLMTTKQYDFIKKIADTLEIDFNSKMSKIEATKWIKDNIEQFNIMQSQNDLENECNSYGLPNQ